MSKAPANARATESATVETTERFPQIESILSAPIVTQTFGVVEGRDSAAFLVRAGAEVIHARRAKGCLVEPETGDTVLIARSEHHGSFVLSVLAGRTEQSERIVAVDGDLTLRSKTGKVSVVAGGGVEVTSGGELAVNAPSVVARTMSATLFSDTLSYVGRKIDVQVERMRVLGQSLETAIDRVTSRMKHSYRTIDELERVKVKELHVNAEATLNMHGKNTLMTAEKLVKLDGEQIHIG